MNKAKYVLESFKRMNSGKPIHESADILSSYQLEAIFNKYSNSELDSIFAELVELIKPKAGKNFSGNTDDVAFGFDLLSDDQQRVYSAKLIAATDGKYSWDEFAKEVGAIIGKRVSSADKGAYYVGAGGTTKAKLVAACKSAIKDKTIDSNMVSVYISISEDTNIQVTVSKDGKIT